jgi:shikimate dehydrogenase
LKQLYGLLGESLKHSISPEIHSLIFKEINIDGYYHLFELERDNLKTAVYGLKALGAKGVNVTIPYKIPIMEFIDELSPEAEKIGAINTICFYDNKTRGYNTDYYGFGMLLDKNNIKIQNKKAVVLGSGGAAKSVLQYLVDKGIKTISVVSRATAALKRNPEFKDFSLISYSELNQLKDEDIIINCTPCGMYPNVDNSPVPRDIVTKFSAAVDLIYNPCETLFLKHAKESSIAYMNGLYMLIGQAVCAQELWNNIKISDEIVDKIYNQFK